MSSSFVADAVRTLLSETAATTGHAFFRALAKAMTEALGTSHALVGRRIRGRHAVEALAFYARGEFVDGFVYELADTPCAGVVDGQACQVTRDLQARFPRDHMLAEDGLLAYFGVPIRSATDDCVGLLVALDDQPREPIEGLEAVLGLFAERAGAELARLEAERQQAEADARYRQIVTSTSEGVWVIDAANVTTYVNPQMAHMLGYAPDEMLGRPVDDFADAAGRQQTQENVKRRQEGISERHQFRLLRKDGSALWTSMSTNPLTDDEGRYVGALAMVTDLSEMRALQAHIEQSQKLESLGRLAGEIAHDFNNLLAGIAACAELLLATEPYAGQVPTLRQILDAAIQGRGLTRQILTYAGREPFEARPTDLNAVVDEVGELIRVGLSKDAALDLALTPEPAIVLADASKLHQVVMNLVTNASQSLPGGAGRIEVRTRIERIDADNPGPPVLGAPLVPADYVVLEVRDDGTGMDEATRARMLDPFFSTKREGRGLGLSVVSGILRSHDGRLAIDTAKGRGTSVRVFLPRHTAPVEPQVQSEADAEPWRGHGLVLLVDDEPLALRAGRALLSHLGFEVETAADGRAALDRARRLGSALRLIVMDQRMPGMDGPRALAAIREAGLKAPAILCTGLLDERDDAEAGFVEVLAKPYRLSELQAAVRRALGG